MASKNRIKLQEDVMFDLFADFPQEDVRDNVFVRSFMDPDSAVVPSQGLPDVHESVEFVEPDPDSVPAPVDFPSAKMNKIEDFGEKIGGARKDLYAVYRDLLSYSSTLEVGNVPFSKAWPKPNYEKLLENGMESWRVDAIRALRETVAHIPRKRMYKWYFQCHCAAFREFAIKVVDGEYSGLEDLCDAIDRYSESDSSIRQTYRDEFRVRAGLYAKVGHREEIPEFSIDYYSEFYPYGWYTAKKEPLRYVYVAKLKNAPYESRYAAWSSSKEETLSLFAGYLQEEQGLSSSDVPKKKRSFDISKHYAVYKMNSVDGNYYICRKVGKNLIRVKGPFSDTESAFDYKNSHLTEIDDCFAAMKNIPNERGEENAPRSGADYRKGDVSPEDFMKAFGFRGVEFGNYVEGPRRQKDLNDAYDALMDLAKITGLPSRALSLGGKLGLAFGARGRGGKNAALAHYESMQTVINLTKKRGAGSLGHEWFHALDNMLARENEKGITSFYSEISNGFGFSNFDLKNAMNKLCSVIASKTDLIGRSSRLDKFKEKPYWGTRREYMARTFESYLKRKLAESGIQNDYLVNVLGEETWKQKTKAPYAYPTKKEMDCIQPFFDKLFESVKQRAEGENIVLYSASADIDTKSLENSLIPYDRLTEDELGFHAFGEQILGIQTSFYDGDPRLHGHFDPATSTIFLNRRSECDLPWVFAHETFHAMKEADPALYKDILELAGGVEAFSKEKIDAYRADRNRPKLPDDVVRQEMLADAFADYTTGRRAIIEMAEKEPTTVRRALNFFARAMSDLKSMFFGAGRAAMEDKYPGVRISREQFQDLSRGLEYLQEELRHSKHLTKGQDMFLSMLAETPRFEGPIHSPYAYRPEEQFEFDCKAVGAMSELYPDKPRSEIAEAVASFSPCGAMRYEDRLMASSQSRGVGR